MNATAIKTRPASTASSRKRGIRERQKSAVWRVVYFLGSLKLALFLLATIALACAVATFFESSFNTKVARAYIYKAPWFLVWLGVLCVNLFAVTLTRLPWQRKHLGFIITHYGIITLLCGAVIGMQFGFEGNVTLRKNSPPIAKITTNRSMIQVESPTDRQLYLMPFDAEVPRPTGMRPRILPVPESKHRIVVDEFSSNIVQEDLLLASDGAAAKPGVSLRLSSSMVGQQASIPLSLSKEATASRDFFGMADIKLVAKLRARGPRLANEAHMVFGRYQPVVQRDGAATGISLRLSEDGSKLTVAGPDGSSSTYDRIEIMGSALRAGEATVIVRDYWPDFAMQEGKPTTASDQPNNPALLAQVTGPAQPDPSATSRPLLEVAPGEDAKQIRYQLSRGGAAYQEGFAWVGESITLGWADWKAEVEKILPKSEVVAEKRDGGGSGDAQGSGIPGFRAMLRAPDGTDGPATWVESGSVATLRNAGTSVRIGYGLELKPVPFSIRLLDFEVPRYEGTETPSNFVSTVEFRDSASGRTKQGVAKMNHPASWPGGLLANVTGVNYKFSQAEWNPRDLDETTLQVLYDPGWLLKWLGSLAICTGIAIMFYLKPKKPDTA